jgi:hypothetical protein
LPLEENNINPESSFSAFSPGGHSDIIKTRAAKKKTLLLFMVLSIIIVLIPHLPAINKDDQIVWTRIARSIRDLSIHSKNAGDLNWHAFVMEQKGDMPITLLFLLAIVKIVSNDVFSHTLDYVLLILSPALVVIIYVLTREIMLNDVTSLFAAFLTTTSFHRLIGILTGLSSNWFALLV